MIELILDSIDGPTLFIWLFMPLYFIGFLILHKLIGEKKAWIWHLLGVLPIIVFIVFYGMNYTKGDFKTVRWTVLEEGTPCKRGRSLMVQYFFDRLRAHTVRPYTAFYFLITDYCKVGGTPTLTLYSFCCIINAYSVTA